MYSIHHTMSNHIQCIISSFSSPKEPYRRISDFQYYFDLFRSFFEFLTNVISLAFSFKKRQFTIILISSPFFPLPPWLFILFSIFKIMFYISQISSQSHHLLIDLISILSSQYASITSLSKDQWFLSNWFTSFLNLLFLEFFMEVGNSLAAVPIVQDSYGVSIQDRFLNYLRTYVFGLAFRFFWNLFL